MADQDFDNLLKNIQEINKALLVTNGNIKLLQDALSRGVQPGSVKELKESLVALQAESESLKAGLSTQGDKYQARIKVLEDMSRSAQNLKKDLEEALQVHQKMLSQKPLSPGLQAQADRFQRGYSLPAPAAGIRPGEELISHPKGYVPKDGLLNEVLAKKASEAADVRLNAEKNAAAIKLESALKVRDAELKYALSLAVNVEKKRRGSFDDIRGDYEEGRRKQREAPYGESVGTKAEQQEKERQQVLQEQIAAHKKYTNALKVAAEKGFGIQDLKNVYNRGTDIDRLQFAKKDDYGVKQNLDLYTNNAGKVTPGISNQFRSFGQGVVRDIGELTKWSIALAAVYGPLNKLKELVDEMITNQTKLAEATITVNSSFLSQGQIFDIAAEAANASGEAVGGVIDAFTQAYRAAGGGADQVERLATAQSLLTASLTLSKLSTLDQAQAIDTLAASIRQTGGDFTKTTELLDSWVRVTKVANVDLATLATGFATLGDAAETAGLNADELNGLLAVIAESSNSTGQEVANAARAIVGGLQSDQGVEALENLGIATKTTSGEMRDLQDILIEVNGLIESGVISQTQLSSLGSDIGGGVRRGAIVTTVLSNYNRALEVSEESSKANGDAEAALAKQLETVATALAKLNNAFSSLAQTMGTEGGFLGIITSSVNGMTSLVKVFDGLTGVLGKATPALLAFIAASLLLKSRGTSSIQAALGSYAVAGPTELDRLRAVTKEAPGGYSAGVGTGAKGRMPFAGNLLGSTGTGSALTQGIGVALIPALQNFFNKDDKFGKTKAGGDLLGGVAGGLLGSITPLGPIVGSMIGTAIAEVFVNKTIDYLTDASAYTKAPTLGESFVPKLVEGKEDAALRDAEAGLYKGIGGGSEAFGKFLTSGVQQTAKILIDEVNEAIKNQDQDALESAFYKSRNLPGNKLLQDAGLTQEFAQQAFNEGKPIEASPESLVYNLAPKAAQQVYDSVLSGINAKDTSNTAPTAFKALVDQNKLQYGDLLASIKESSTDRLKGERLSGDVKGVEYARQTKALSGFDTKALQYYTALGEEFISVNKGVDDATEAFQAFNDIIVTGVAESIPEITAIVGEITTLTNLLDDVVTNKDELIRLYGSVEAAREKLPELKTAGAGALTDVYDQSRLNKLSIPNIQGDITKPLLNKEEDLVAQRTKQLQEQFYKGFLKLPDDMYQALVSSFDEFAVPVKAFEDAVTGFKTVTETDAQFRQAAIAQLAEEGKLGSQDTNPFGIQQLDMTSQEGAGLQGQIQYFEQYLADNFKQYQQNPEDFGVIFSDYVTDVLHGDNLAVQLALQQLNDKAQKQLDGQYNIPEGATFWVPLTAAYYRPQNEGGGAGGMQGLPENTNATSQNTQALLELSQAIYMKNMGEKDYIPGAGQTSGQGLTPDERWATDDKFRLKNETEERTWEKWAATPGGQEFKGAWGEEDSAGGSDIAAQFSSFIESLKQNLTRIFSQPTGGFHGYEKNTGLGDTGGRGGRMPDTSVNTASTARLDIRFESTTQLMVDGRVLATIIKPHLASDLLKLEGSQGTVTKRYVI